MGWICPRCGAENPFDCKRCNACGRRVVGLYRLTERLRGREESRRALRRIKAGWHLVGDGRERMARVVKPARIWMIAALIICALLTGVNVFATNGALGRAADAAQTQRRALLARVRTAAASNAVSKVWKGPSPENARGNLKLLKSTLKATGIIGRIAVGERADRVGARMDYAVLNAPQRFWEVRRRLDEPVDLHRLVEEMQGWVTGNDG